MTAARKPATVAEYIAAAAPAARPMLRQLRATIRTAVPDAEEKLSYGMPYYSFHGRLAYFAAFTSHVSYFVMPRPAVLGKHAARIAPYRTSKATLRFPLGTKLPVALLRSIVKAVAAENAARQAKPKARRPAAARSATRRAK
jgi:uncharacterized protein YdhG (YjbR/CyaY superfamily)